ncbi:hypothetical protein D932_03679 [Enterococcus casseliflavus 14-MB-W-14]|nr:hypothetical protein D932_03679 [Enterococcus casseliflavus 14-MB-W-14]
MPFFHFIRLLSRSTILYLRAILQFFSNDQGLDDRFFLIA